MNDLADLTAELQATWHRDIPPAAAMAITVAAYDGTTLTVGAPLAVNRNLHGTAFAGSLFSISVLTGWGAAWLALRRHGLSGLIVVADSRIKYRRAVTNDLRCRCAIEPAVAAQAAEVLAATGRAELELACTIEADGRLAVAFEGTYVVQTKPAH